MSYAPRAELVSDSTISSVLSLLEDVGYVPGQDVVGLGVSLESAGASVATVDQALVGITRVADDQARNLAVRTVLLGSYDLDRSGSIDRAREIDAPPCEVWSALDGAFPNFVNDFGFSEPGAPYLGAVMLNINGNVREPAYRRITACALGEEPPVTDPTEVPAVAGVDSLPPPVERFLDADAAAEIVRLAGMAGRGPAEWAQGVRSVLLGRYDRDRSGLLDEATEVRGIPCGVWQAVAATHPTRVVAAGGEEPNFLQEDLGISAEQQTAAWSLLVPCLTTSGGTARVRVRQAPPAPTSLPPERIRASVTIPLRGLGGVPDEERRYLPAKTVLLAMFDLDRSGAVDRARELDAVPCDVWSALDVTFPGFAERFGFVSPSVSTPYRGDVLFSFSDRLRPAAERRIRACERGETPPPTNSSLNDSGRRRDITVPSELKEFLDLETSAQIVQAAIAAQPGSAAWAATVRSVLINHYDLDGSGSLDQSEELDEVPCTVWSTIEATYGAPLSGVVVGNQDRFLGDELGIAFEQRSYTQSRLASCQ
jgi:hypothetical protein